MSETKNKCINCAGCKAQDKLYKTLYMYDVTHYDGSDIAEIPAFSREEADKKMLALSVGGAPPYSKYYFVGEKEMGMFSLPNVESPRGNIKAYEKRKAKLKALKEKNDEI